MKTTTNAADAKVLVAAKALVTADAPSMFSSNATIVPADKLRALRRALVEAGVLNAR